MPYSAELDRYAKFTVAPTTVALSTNTARSTALTAGLWELWCSVDCFFLQGGSAVDATLTSIPLTAKTVKLIHVEAAADAYVAAILAASTANLFVSKRQP